MSAPSLILIASEQLWPNLHALVHWSREGGGLDAIHILHTENEKASAVPARRLFALLKNSPPGRPFRFRHLHPPAPVGQSPQEVADKIASIFAASPADMRWIVVANGGLKTMTLGLLEAMASPRAEVVYSEIGGKWQRVTFSAGRVSSHPLPQINPADMDHLPVETLVGAQHSGDTNTVQIKSHRVKALNTEAIARACMTERGWNWKTGFTSCGLEDNEKASEAFEQWCGALLLDLGVKNIVSGLTVSGDSGQNVSENDLICIHKGRFHYIEVKLLTEDDERANLNEIARKACTNCLNLGGASGTPHLLIPNWKLKPEELSLLKLYRPAPRVLHAENSGKFISKLAEALGATVPPHLQQLENDIIEWMNRHGFTRAFGSEHHYLRSGSSEAPASLFASVGTFCDVVRRERGQNWLLLRNHNHIEIFAEAIPNKPPPSGWTIRGQSWHAAKPWADHLAGKFKDEFSRFLNKTVPPGEVIEAWHRIFPADQPNRDFTVQAGQTVVEGRLLPEKTKSARSFVYEALLNGTSAVVFVPAKALPFPPPEKLRIELLGPSDDSKGRPAWNGRPAAL